MRPRSLRVRLTLLVSALFALALTGTGLIARSQLSRALEADATSYAQALLDDFFEPTIPGTVETTDVTQFVYLDADGNELTGQGLEDLLTSAIESEIPNLLEPGAAITFDVPSPLTFETGPPVDDAFLSEVAIFQPIKATGTSSTMSVGSAILVTQPAIVGDVPISVGVSTPRQPINDTINTVTIAALILLPILTGIVGAVTWLTTVRALRPVEAIRSQVALTDPDRLDHHVPQPGSGDEIDRLATTMNDMLDRLHQATLTQRRFISDASHELRSPITATLATIDTTDAAAVAARWPETAATIRFEQERLAGLVDDLLLLAQLDESEMSTRFEDVDLDELALGEAQRPRSRPVQVIVEAPQRVSGNARLLGRCLANLVDNAARHAATHVEVTVATNQSGQPVIRVDDDGPGVPVDMRQLVFERFARLDEARARKDGGAGLGLAIASRLAEQHHATLTVGDSPLGGARFEIRFRTA